MKKFFSTLFAFAFFTPFYLHAQSTYQQVYNLFQTKCTVACHSGSLPSGNLDLSGTTADVYNRLVNATPVNPVAAGKGYKLVEPGYPFRSFLMKKVNHGLDTQNDLVTGEGASMPNNSVTLDKEEIEIIRQWIIWGAKDTGITYNANLIHDYYSGPGVAEMAAPITPEQEGKEGIQIKFGPVFLGPHGEFEFFQVHNPKLQADKEITTLRSTLPPMSHHWVLRSITPAGEAAFGAPPMDGANINSQILVYQHTSFMAIWQFTDELDLPAGTAHFQDSAEAFLLNLHMANYRPDSIVAATAYVNIYTQPRGSGAVEMKTGLAPYGGFNPFILQIPNTGVFHTLQTEIVEAGETRYFWNIQSHTHALGKDFDIFLRNANGTKGSQIYEGFFNENYTVNKGYYDYSHPAVRTFDPMLQVDMNDGLIAEATWLNNGPDTIGFGLTTKEEMFVTYFSYTTELPTAVKETGKDDLNISVFPNPGKDNFNLNYTLKNSGYTTIDLYNTMGTKVKPVFAGRQEAGKQVRQIDISKEGLPSGVYFVALALDGSVTTRKIIVSN